MNTQAPENVTQLLQEWNQGSQAARDQLLTLVYDELRRLAHRYLQRERGVQTLQTTALVNEVYLRLFDANRVPCQDRQQFFGIAARVMRQVLVDVARKRGGQRRRVPLEDVPLVAQALDLDLLALDEALDDLAQHDAELSRVVELRFFAECSIEQTAELLGVSTDTVKRRWKRAKLYLYNALASPKGASDEEVNHLLPPAEADDKLPPSPPLDSRGDSP